MTDPVEFHARMLSAETQNRQEPLRPGVPHNGYFPITPKVSRLALDPRRKNNGAARTSNGAAPPQIHRVMPRRCYSPYTIVVNFP